MRPVRMPQGGSHLERELALQMLAANLSPVKEYRFAREAVGNPTRAIRATLADAGLRDWRFDMALPPLWIAIEVEGGSYSGGRHTRGTGFESDCEKYNRAAVLGWTVLRFTGRQIRSGQALDLILQMAQRRRDPAI